MKRLARLLVFLSMCFLLPSAIRASDPLPRVHIFLTQDCSYCQNALRYLRAQEAETGDFKLLAYDVGRNADDAALFVRFVAAIGLRDAQIPMVIIGRDVLIGYDGDATSGLEFSAKISACRVTDCPDLMRIFINGSQAPEIASSRRWRLHQRWAAAAMPR